jgi:hypothetical protein
VTPDTVNYDAFRVIAEVAVTLTGFLMPWAFEIYYLGLLWCVGIAAYLFAMILFDASDAEAAVPSTEG